MEPEEVSDLRRSFAPAPSAPAAPARASGAPAARQKNASGIHVDISDLAEVATSRKRLCSLRLRFSHCVGREKVVAASHVGGPMDVSTVTKHHHR